MFTHARSGAVRGHCFQLVLAVVLYFVVAPSQASTLTDSRIESFMASLQDMQAIFEDSGEYSLDEELADDEDDMDMDFANVYSSMVEELSNHPPTQRKVSAIAKRHGFESLAEWARSGDQIYTAYMAINMEGQPAMDESAMENYMASLEHMPEEEKNNIRRMMGNAIKSNESIRNAPTEDIEAVRPYLDEITALHDMDAN